MKQSQSQPPIANSKNQKLLNPQQQPQPNSIYSKSRNYSLKKISYNQVGSSNNVQSLNSLGLLPKIEQKTKQRINTSIHNQLTGIDSSLQKQGKWHLPNSLMKKRQRLLTQGNNIIHQNTLNGNDSFVSLSNNHSNKKITLPITKQKDSIKNTMVDFRKKIQQNRIYIKKQIEKKNKDKQNNNDSRVKRDTSLLVIDDNTKAMKKKKDRVASSRFVVVMQESNQAVGENGVRANNNSSNKVKSKSKRTIQTPSNNNGNKLQRSFVKRKSESNKNKKHSNVNSYNTNNNKDKTNNNVYGSNNNNNNLQNKNNNKTNRNKPKTHAQASSSMNIKNKNNNNNYNLSPQKDKNQHSLSKRKSEGLFGELQVILDEKIRQDVSKERILEEEVRLRELLLKLNNKYKQNETSNNHRAKYHSYHELAPDSNNNNKAISTEYHLSSHHPNQHMSLQSSSQHPLILLQSTDILPLAQSGTKLPPESNHQQWHKLQLQSTSQISYTKSSFENELNKISQYADRNDASLEKYLSMRKQLMKLGFQVQFGYNQHSKNKQNRKKNHQNSTNDMEKDKENNSS